MSKYRSSKDAFGFVVALFVMPFLLNWMFEVPLKPTTYIAFVTIIAYLFTADFALFLWEKAKPTALDIFVFVAVYFFVFGMYMSKHIKLLLFAGLAALLYFFWPHLDGRGFGLLVGQVPTKIADTAKVDIDWGYVGAAVQALICIASALGILYLFFRRKEDEERLVQDQNSSGEEALKPVSTRWVLCALLVVVSLVLVVGWLARSGYYKG